MNHIVFLNIFFDIFIFFKYSFCLGVSRNLGISPANTNHTNKRLSLLHLLTRAILTDALQLVYTVHMGSYTADFNCIRV